MTRVPVANLKPRDSITYRVQGAPERRMGVVEAVSPASRGGHNVMLTTGVLLTFDAGQYVERAGATK
jgi:hypothetical protein